mgnify:CR=1 FL=1
MTYKTNPDLIIVVECKAQTTKHESINKDKYSEFAVDGALLYSSYLSKDFDVLSIAVSGENKRELKVSHFLQLKGEKQAIQKFDDKLLPATDYLNGYLKNNLVKWNTIIIKDANKTSNISSYISDSFFYI